MPLYKLVEGLFLRHQGEVSSRLIEMKSEILGPFLNRGLLPPYDLWNMFRLGELRERIAVIASLKHSTIYPALPFGI